MAATDVDALVHRAADRDRAHGVVPVPGLVLGARRVAAPSLAAAQSQRTDRNRPKSRAHVHARTNLVITASRNHAHGHRNGTGMSPALARGLVRSHTPDHVPSRRTTSPVRALGRAHARPAPNPDPAIVPSPRTSRTTSPARPHPKITITLRSVMKAWKIKHYVGVCIRLTVPKARAGDDVCIICTLTLSILKLSSFTQQPQANAPPS